MQVQIKTTNSTAEVDVTNKVGKPSHEASLDDIFTTFNFDLPYFFYDIEGIGVFSKVKATSGADFDFSGMIINVAENDLSTVTITAVSDSFYLSTYEDIFKVKNFRADKVIKQVLNSFDSSFEVDIVPLQNAITKIYNGDTIIDVIDDVLKQSEGASGKKLYRTFENNKLTVFDTPTKYELDVKGSMSKLKINRNGEDIKTQVKVYTEDKKTIAVVAEKKNNDLIAKAGLIQKVHKIKAKDKAEADLVAENILAIYSKIKSTGSFTHFGDYKARVGMGLTIEGTEYIISAIKHTIEDEIHLMSIGVVFYEQ